MATNVYGTKPAVSEKRKVTDTNPQIIGMPFPIGASGSNNYINKVTGLKLAKNNLRQLLSTEKGERVMLPEYGVSLRKYLFAPLDNQTVAGIRDDILTAINTYAKGVTVTQLFVYPDNQGGSVAPDLNRIIVKLTGRIRAIKQSDFTIEVSI